MKNIRILAIVFLFIVAVNALLAGYSFIVEPDGSGLGIPLSMLRHSPFADFFVPGLVLFFVNGVLNLFAAGVVIWNKWPARYLLLALQGILLTGWIAVQVLMLREFNFLHGIMGCIGIFLVSAGIGLRRAGSGNDRIA